ncbi:hypothetical protein LCGC14_2322800 [marine sediment metagenome]|uniref:Uncharacterized protein n=1 Tax=marine sediment metagenome TaxID=412755 RepID=A0A0F9EUP7_9ZZZZ
MPYIKSEQRIKLDRLTQGFDYSTLSEGELNYFFTRILTIWINPINYARYNSAVGVLESVKLELYRRRIAEYEDGKKEINGDVY